MAQAGWYDDPTGDFVERYWDGDAWTAHVVDDTGATGIDRPLRRSEHRRPPDGFGRPTDFRHSDDFELDDDLADPRDRRDRASRTRRDTPITRPQGIARRDDDRRDRDDRDDDRDDVSRLRARVGNRFTGSLDSRRAADRSRDFPRAFPVSQAAPGRGRGEMRRVDLRTRDDQFMAAYDARRSIGTADVLTYGGAVAAAAGLVFVGWFGELTAPATGSTSRGLLGSASIAAAFDETAAEVTLPNSFASSYFDAGWILTLLFVVWVVYRHARRLRPPHPVAIPAIATALAAWAVASTLLFKSWLADTFDGAEIGIGFWLTIAGLTAIAAATLSPRSHLFDDIRSP